MGLTDQGYTAESYAERRVRLVDQLRGSHETLAATDFRAERAEGQIVDTLTEELTDLDESVKAGFDSADPNAATKASALSIARLRGTNPRPASKGFCFPTVVCSGGPFAIGELIAYVDGEPDNRWVNAEVVETGTSNPRFEAESPGASYVALSGTLTQKVAVTGWTSITNDEDAVTGRDEDTPEQTLYRSEAARYAPSSHGIAAIRAAVLAVDGVIDCLVENGAGSVHVLVWDGATNDADDDELAAAIWSKLTEGIATTGTVENTSTGYLVKFDRATAQSLYASVQITGAGVDFAAVKLAAQSVLPQLLGGTVRWAQMLSAILKVPGVTDVDELLLDDADPPVQEGDNFTAAADKWFELDTGDIDVAYA